MQAAEEKKANMTQAKALATQKARNSGSSEVQVAQVEPLGRRL